MKKRVYFVRHGQTDWNLEGRQQGSEDVPLNAVGERQARDLARGITGLRIEHIVSSPRKRAARTAEIINESFHVPLSYSASLTERKFGQAEGLLRSEIIEKWKDTLTFDEAGWIDWSKSSIPGGEVAAAQAERLKRALREIFEDSPRDNVMIVSHGGNMHCLTKTTWKNCSCFAAAYDTEIGELSEIKRVWDGE